MNMTKQTVFIALGVVAILALAFIAVRITPSPMTGGESERLESGMLAEPVAQQQQPDMATKGSYEPYAPEKLAKADGGKVVLFFRASWCPTCHALDADIRSHSSDIPGDLTILDVDYDNATALKQKYGVTVQHTLVQVDAHGNQLAKWIGSPTLADLATQVR